MQPDIPRVSSSSVQSLDEISPFQTYVTQTLGAHLPCSTKEVFLTGHSTRRAPTVGSECNRLIASIDIDFSGLPVTRDRKRSGVFTTPRPTRRVVEGRPNRIHSTQSNSG